jgi:AraC-like DNA-binding protein
MSCSRESSVPNYAFAISECSVIDAGLEAGFENPSHFARVFRRLVGTTPSRFRAEEAIPKMFPVKAHAGD